jgi:hypothetical protein
MAKLGPRLRSDAKLVAQALSEADAEDLARKLVKKSIKLTAGEREFKIMPDEIKVIKETESAGRKVEVIDIPEPSLTLLITLP